MMTAKAPASRIAMPEANTDLLQSDPDFPMNPDGWYDDRKVCEYFNAKDESKICTEDPEYFISSYCDDPGCDAVHVRYYCLRHFGSRMGLLAHELCKGDPYSDYIYFVREGLIPPMFQIIDWGRIGSAK